MTQEEMTHDEAFEILKSFSLCTKYHLRISCDAEVILRVIKTLVKEAEE